MAIAPTRRAPRTTTAELRTTTRAAPAARRGGCAGCGAPAGGTCSCQDACVPCGCGKLNCLCRPSWFAGMVLRDEDLQRLDRYIIERFRRVNLQFFGPGVVNGLEVRCDPCGPGVVVGCGHAISPCGDDIVVCDDSYVDVCKLIEKCRQKERDDCLPHQRPRACPDLNEKWVLAIEYTERPERGVLPLRREAAKACGCGGGSGGCGCGGEGASGGCGCEGGASGWSGKGTERPRGAPPACEPTLLCEDFRFRICPPPDLPPACRTGRGDDKDAETESGPMLERIKCCTDALMKDLPTVPPFNPQNPGPDVIQRSDEWYRWFCLIKQHLLNFVSRFPVSNCQALADIQRLTPLRRQDFPSDAAYLAWWFETLQRLAVILVELLFACVCSGLLPPCPDSATSTSVPIATVTVSYAGSGCRVVSVCNWTRLRKYSANLRTLNYWWSFLPFGRELRRLLECLCCDLLGNLFADDDQPGRPGFTPNDDFDGPGNIGGVGRRTMAAAGPGGGGGGDVPRDVSGRLRERLDRRLRPLAVGAEFDRMAATARAVSRSAAPVEPLAALGDLLGFSAEEQGPFGSAGRTAPAEALLFNSLGAPFLRGIAASPGLRNFGLDLGPELGGIGLGTPPAEGRAETEARTEEMTAMRAEIAELRARLDGLEGGGGPRKGGGRRKG